MRCEKCGCTFYVDFDPFQGIVEPQCPGCGYPYAGDHRRSEKIMEYLKKEFEKLRKGEDEDA